MRGVLRLVLIWLMVAVVPIKGMAATAMIGCGPAHDEHPGAGHAQALGPLRAFDAVLTDRLSGHNQRAENATAASVGHHGSGAVPADFDHAAGTLQPADPSPQPACSHCAPCCAAALLPPEPRPVAHAQPSASPGALVDAWHAGVVTGVPDRPPRSFLA